MIIIRETKATVDLQEYDNKIVSKDKLSFIGDQLLEKCCEELAPLVKIDSDISGNFRFTAEANVGVLNAYGLRVQVQPKMSAQEFCTLIRYTFGGKIQAEHLRAHTELSWGTGFEDALANLLCEEVESIIQIGLSRRYEERCEGMEVLRGRVLWERNFPWRGAKAKEIICRHHKLTYDNLDNQIILAGLQHAFLILENMDTKRRTGNLINRLHTITSGVPITYSDFGKAASSYTRLNEHYRVAHGLCRMFLSTLRPDNIFHEGKDEACGIVLDMAEVFERFVERLLIGIMAPQGFKLCSQVRDHGAILDDEGNKYTSIRPDIEVWKGTKAVGVIDAKYKPYWASDPNKLRPERKVSNEDLYQLFFYQQRMRRKYSFPNLPPAVIAAPLPEEDERNGRTSITQRYKRIRWQTEIERDGDIRLVLIPITRFLRLVRQFGDISRAVKNLGIEDITKIFL
jgi:5-methylcytosine-specific restriction endonuclease McrBC regulatory subunit McrC